MQRPPEHSGQSGGQGHGSRPLRMRWRAEKDGPQLAPVCILTTARTSKMRQGTDRWLPPLAHGSARGRTGSNRGAWSSTRRSFCSAPSCAAARMAAAVIGRRKPPELPSPAREQRSHRAARARAPLWNSSRVSAAEAVCEASLLHPDHRLVARTMCAGPPPLALPTECSGDPKCRRQLHPRSIRERTRRQTTALLRPPAAGRHKPQPGSPSRRTLSSRSSPRSSPVAAALTVARCSWAATDSPR